MESERLLPNVRWFVREALDVMRGTFFVSFVIVGLALAGLSWAAGPISIAFVGFWANRVPIAGTVLIAGYLAIVILERCVSVVFSPLVWKQASERHFPTMPLWTTVNVLSASIGLFSLIAYTLTEHRLLGFGSHDPWSYVAFFAWRLADLVPAADIPKTMKWVQPLGYEGASEGALVLMFSVAIVLPILAAIRNGWKGYMNAETREAREEWRHDSVGRNLRQWLRKRRYVEEKPGIWANGNSRWVFGPETLTPPYDLYAILDAPRSKSRREIVQLLLQRPMTQFDLALATTRPVSEVMQDLGYLAESRVVEPEHFNAKEVTTFRIVRGSGCFSTFQERIEKKRG